MNALFPLVLITFAMTTIVPAWAQAVPCGADVPCAEAAHPVYQREPARPSWIFAPSTYTHDPETGARVAQYMRTPPVEPLDDPRIVTSRYTRRRTVVRGIDGSNDTYYEVQAWGNGRGGLDAEWERFHDAWKESELQGGFFNQEPGFQGPGFGGFHDWRQSGFPNSGFWPGSGFPGSGFWPGHGQWPKGGPWRKDWQRGDGRHDGGGGRDFHREN